MRSGQLLGFVLRQVLVAVLTLVGIVILVFIALRFVPGNYADVLLGPRATPKMRELANEKYGLDEPQLEQFYRWLVALLQGDLGTSLRSGDSVASEILDRAALTVELGLVAGLFTLLVGVTLGVLGGVAGGRSRTQAPVRLGNALLLSLPEILVGGFLVYVISKYVTPFSTGTWPSLTTDPVANFYAVLPPAFVASTLGIGFVMATTRRAVAGALDEPYVRAARVRGTPWPTIYRRHLWRNTATPVLTVFGIYLAYLLGGVAIVEELFALHGLGSYLVESAAQRDYPAVQGVVLVTAAAFVVMNMLIDVMYGVIDPRIGQRKSA